MSKLYKFRFILLAFFFAAQSSILWAQTRAEREFNFAQKLYEDKLFLLAAEQFREFAEKFPNNEQADHAWFLCGEAHFSIGEYKEAFNAFKELEIGYPRSKSLPVGRFRLAQCQIARGDFGAAAELFKRVAKFHPESEKAPLALLESGRAYIQDGAPRSAITQFHELISAYPDSPERITGYLEIVKAYLALNDYNEAISQIDGILRVYGPDFKDARVYLLRAEVFESLGQLEEAQNLYLKITTEFNGTTEAQKALYKLGDLAQNRADYENSLMFYNQYLAENSSDPASLVYMKIGDIHFKQENYENALKSYENALNLKDSGLELERDYKIAQVLIYLRQFATAEGRLREVINSQEEESPYLEKAYVNLTDVLIKLERPHDALQIITKFTAKFPESDALELVSFKEAEIIENHLTDYTRALRKYDEYITRFPRSPKVDDAQMALGRCYEKMGEYPMALLEYEKYRNRYPAGDDFDWVEKRKQMISEIIYLQKDGGFAELAKLFATVTQNQIGKNLDFELGKTFYQVKQFEQAISQFKKALAAPDDGVVRTEGLYYLGSAYFQLAEKSLLQSQPERAEALYDSAAISLNFVTQKEMESEHIQVAAYLLAKIELRELLSAERLTKLAELRDEWQSRFPNSKYLDFLLIGLGDLVLEQSGLRRHFVPKLQFGNEMSGEAQTDTGMVGSAISYFDAIIQNYPAGKYYEEALFKKAAALVLVGEDSTVLGLLTDFSELHPNSKFVAEVLFLKARLERKMGDLVSAILDLQKITQEYFYSPVVLKAQAELGEIHFQKKDFQSALDSYQNMQRYLGLHESKNGIDISAILFKEARLYEQLQMDNEALKSYVDFIQQSPNDENAQDAMLAVARIAQKQNNLKFAEEYYQVILNHAAESGYKYEAHIALADIFFRQNFFEKASTHYSAAIAVTQKPEKQRYPESQWIRCLYNRKQFSAADAEVKNFKKKYKNTRADEGQFLVDKGNAYIFTKKFKLAEKVFKKLKGDFKKSDFGAQGEFGLGKSYLITNHTEDALKILTAIPSKYPDSEVTALTYLNLGDFYTKSQQVENAISAFKKVLQHPKGEKHYENALLYLIQCYRDVGFWDQAIAKTRDYLERFPNSGQYFRRKIDLAFFLMKLKEYHRAIGNFQQLLPLADAESEAEIQFYIAQSYNEMGHFDRATSEYLKVKYLTKPSKLPWHVTALFEAGRCLLRLDETEQAKNIFERIVKERGAKSNFGRFAQQKLEEIAKSQKLTQKN